MTPLPPALPDRKQRPSLWRPIAGPAMATLAIGAVALAAFAAVTIALLLAGFALAAVLVWRVSGLLPRRPRSEPADITGPHPYTINLHPTREDHDAFDAFLDARIRARH